MDPNNQQNQNTNPRIILLIEDDPLLVKMYSTKFIMEGFNVMSALDGETGLKMAVENNVDFIILDLMMPKLSGLQLLEKLRQYPNKNDTPVIVLTNLARQEDNDKAIKLGAKEFLVKANLTPTQVVEKVNLYLNPTSKPIQ